MTVALYADYIADVRGLFTQLDRHPELFQTFEVRLELAAAGSVIVYETKRRRGQTDSLYYGRSANGANQKVAQSSAFSAMDRFFAIGQFVALTEPMDGEYSGKGAQTAAVNARYPHCAVNFSYRKKGEPVARAMLMVFVGFNDDADAQQYVSEAGNGFVLESEQPYRAAWLHEWK